MEFCHVFEILGQFESAISKSHAYGSTNGRFLNPWSDGAWTISNVHFPLHEINEVANDKQYRYLYDYEVFVYERMTKNWFGGMKKEYDLLLLFG